MQKFKIILFIILIIFNSMLLSDNVYKIKVRTQSGATKVLTGFTINSQKGIITALHGVIDASKIYVITTNGKTFSNIQISHIDKDKDLAIIDGHSLNQLSVNNGFKATTSIPKEWTEVLVIGYPYALDLQESKVKVRKPKLVTLESLLPSGSILSHFKERNSPNTNNIVVSLQGDIVPGLSGAPIIDQDGNVFAIANGGIKGGSTGHTWAIPINNMKFQTFNKNINLPYQNSIDNLYSDLADLPPELPINKIIDEKEIQNQGFVKYILNIQRNGEISLMVNMKNEHANESLCIIPKLFLYDDSNKLLNSPWNDRFCVSNINEKNLYNKAMQTANLLNIDLNKVKDLLGINIDISNEPKLDRTFTLKAKIKLENLSKIHHYDVTQGIGSKSFGEIYKENF